MEVYELVVLALGDHQVIQFQEKVGEHLKCKNCDAEIEVSSAQKKQMQKKSTAKYEKNIQEHNTWCELKAQECYEAAAQL
ncbi:hypothetical protein M0R45_004839 [Rubus argutus]|uniref:Uncharacterized protein n=1 Tax=Rubus argutus TaxID=59490 RepID=A0AAW1YKZ8_RUBAR